MKYWQKQVAKITALIFLIFTLSIHGSYAQSSDNLKPEPYGPDEFPKWQHDLRRVEIITFGSLPFITFFTSIGYDVYRYSQHNYKEEYLPWPFKKTDIAIPLNEKEQKNIFFASLGISFLFALIDYTVQTTKHKKQVQKQSIQESQKDQSIKIIPIQTIEPDKENSIEGILE